ncbi:MAG: hypothetical protein H7232_10195, partial [Aeromicrobium sp.]|nr:hypothetical protein [Burkholderiales bacterium]
MTNNNTGADVGTSYYAVRFTLGATGTVFTSAPAAPAGWYVSSYSTTSVTFRVTASANGIASGQSVVFSMAVAMGASSADLPESFAAVQGFYTNPPKNNKKTNASSLGSWTRKSLAITTFQITDTLGNPVSAITSGSSFQLRMTVKNNSSITQAAVVSNFNPPSKTGTVTQALTSTAGSPLSLVPGASGTIIFTYSTVLTDNGTISFAANAQNGGTVTSISATSGILSVSSFTASTVVAPTCQYAGSNIAVTMTVSNGSLVFPVTSVTPTLTLGGAPVTIVSGPSPASVASIGVSSSTTFNWVYQLNVLGVTNSFTFSGSATGTRNASPITTPVSTSTPSTTRGIFTAIVNPVSTNAGSMNAELSFTVTNSGCNPATSVAVTIPSGWTWANDAYSLVNISAASSIETWTVSGANPVTFTAPSVAGQIPLTFSGSYSLVFSATPAAATTSTFTLRVTDSSGAFVDVPV